MLYHTCVQGKAELLFFFHFIIVIYNPKWNQDQAPITQNKTTRKTENTLLCMSFEQWCLRFSAFSFCPFLKSVNRDKFKSNN